LSELLLLVLYCTVATTFVARQIKPSEIIPAQETVDSFVGERCSRGGSLSGPGKVERAKSIASGVRKSGMRNTVKVKIVEVQ
jgi:hypothetical protein